jgi:hypothetical protein
MRNAWTTIAVAVALVQLGAQRAHAEDEIYVWTTADGAVHYTDDLERVPDAFRNEVRIAHKEGGGSHQRAANARAPATPQRDGVPPKPGGAEPAPAQDPEAAEEARWRDQARAIDERIAGLAPQVEACATDHVNRSPGDGSRKRREERDEAQHCAQAREGLASALAEREALEESAHLEGVPPGWVRSPD